MSDSMFQYFKRYDTFEGSTPAWTYECQECEEVPAWCFAVPRKGSDQLSDDTLLNLGMHLQSHKKTDMQKAEAIAQLKGWTENENDVVDPRFDAVLARIKKLHDAKSQDYGAINDPLANVRASEDFGVPAWVGALVRQNDKLTRIKSFLNRGELVFEKVEDSLLDSAVYAIIACVLYEEEGSSGS